MLNITPEAVEQARIFLIDNNLDLTKHGLRVAVKAGGCAGLKYSIELESKEPTDRVLLFGDIQVFIDPKSYLYIGDTEIGWDTSTLNGGFTFNNPNAKRTCGCGTSFI